MSAEEKIIPSVEEVEGTHKDKEGNDPDSKPLSETGYQINPDGSISHPGEKWDKESYTTN